jgi:hypothetical protein
MLCCPFIKVYLNRIAFAQELVLCLKQVSRTTFIFGPFLCDLCQHHFTAFESALQMDQQLLAGQEDKTTYINCSLRVATTNVSCLSERLFGFT